MPATAHKIGPPPERPHKKKAAALAKPARTAIPRKKAIAKSLIVQSRSSGGKGTTGSRAGGAKNIDVIAYQSTKGVDDYVRRVARATPMEIVEIERQGVFGSFIKDLGKRMEIPSSRIFAILGIPRATAEKKAMTGERIAGRGGQAAIGMVKLLGIAEEIAANSTARETQGFNAAKWLGEWIERPQPALGGRKPAELLDTPTGADVVARLLGAIESGAYQ